MMRRCAGLDTDKTRRQLLEESSDVTPLQLAPDDRIAFRVNAMDLKNRLRDVETNRRDSLHDPVLRIRSPSWRPRSVALTCRWRSRPQHHDRNWLTALVWIGQREPAGQLTPKTGGNHVISPVDSCFANRRSRAKTRSRHPTSSASVRGCDKLRALAHVRACSTRWRCHASAITCW